MSTSKALIGTAAAVAAISTAAQAEVTASEVWQDWQELSARMGQTLTVGDERASGGTLTIRDLQITSDMPDGETSGQIDEVVFRERGDGTVEITMSPEYRITSTAAAADEPPVTVDIFIRQEGLSLIASGDAENTDYDLAADRLAVSVEPQPLEGEDEGEGMVELVLSELAGTYDVSGDAEMSIASDFSAAGMAFAASFDDSEGAFRMTGEISELQSESTTILPEGTTTIVGATGLPDGMETDGTFRYGASRYDISVDDGEGPFDLSSSAASGEISVAVDAETLSYGGGSNDVAMTASGAAIPIPEIALAMDSTEFALTVPAAPSEEPRDLGLRVQLAGVTADEAVWSMFDPTGTLPRDPATLILDLDGSARLTTDIMAGDTPPTGAPPGEMESLTITELLLSAVGAELSGSGSFTFPDTPGPMAMPAGQVSLMLVGGTQLIDRLVSMGLVPEDQAMGARMMLGMFARPGEGEDTLVSDIELTEDGQIIANGQRIR